MKTENIGRKRRNQLIRPFCFCFKFRALKKFFSMKIRPHKSKQMGLAGFLVLTLRRLPNPGQQTDVMSPTAVAGSADFDSSSWAVLPSSGDGPTSLW